MPDAEGPIRCMNCREDNKKGANFCRNCGARLSGGKIRCPGCEALIDSDSRFCPECGTIIAGVPTGKKEEPTGEMVGLRWKRGSDDFAKRIDLERTESALQRGVVVEEGTRALLVSNGVLKATLEPGKYDLKTFTDALKESVIRGGGNIVAGVAGWFSAEAKDSVDKTVEVLVYNPSTVLLIDSGDVELDLNIDEVYTNDPLMIDIACNTVLRLEDARLFFVNVMKSRETYSITDLRNSLIGEIQNAFNEAIGQKSVKELHSNLSLKQEFENVVKEHLNRTLGQSYGLRFFQLRTIRYRNNRYDKIKGVNEETFLLVSESDARLSQRKRLFDVYDNEQLQVIFEETRKVQHTAQRQKVWADLRALVNSDKMNEIKSADDLEEYVHEINKGKYLREDEVSELLSGFEQSGKKRAFLLEKIDMEHELARERHGIELRKTQMVGVEENELAAWEVKAKRERREFEEALQRTRIKKETLGVEREVRIEDAKADSDVKDLEREGDQKDLDMGLSAVERIKKMKAQEKREEMNIEAERLERLSKVGIEALISSSGKEQAEMLKELKKTEMLKGMTEEQILAMGAANSKDLAEAYKEKYKGLSAEKQEALYEKMMAQKDNSMKTMQEMFNKALETQRDATVGVSQGGKVVYPPIGSFGPSGPLGPGGSGAPGFYNVNMESGTKEEELETIWCGGDCKKRVKVKPGSKFCPICGKKFFQDEH